MTGSAEVASGQPASEMAREKPLLELIGSAQAGFRARLDGLHKTQGGLERAQYVAYLSMQVHLTRNVQKYFYRIAAHPDVTTVSSLRKFLLRFGTDEAPHYKIALKDLADLGEKCLPKPFTVELWHAYFEKILDRRPFLRLGAACYLENLAGTSGEAISTLFAHSPYLRPANMRFFLIHKHESDKLDHGNQILNEMRSAKLSDAQWADLASGAEKAHVLYTMMVDEALGGSRTNTLPPV